MYFQTNNPDQGTGSLTVDEAVAQLSSVWDSAEEDGATENVDDVETDVQNDDAETYEVYDEQPDELDSEEAEYEDDHNDDVETGDEEEPVEKTEISDDAKIKIGDQEITISEVKQGFMRQQDYTVKTQQLAVERQEVQQASATYRNMLQHDFIADMKRQIQAELHLNAPNFEELKESDPYEYARQRDTWDKRGVIINQLIELERATLAEEAREAETSFSKKQEESHSQFVARYPEYADRNKSVSLYAEMSKLLKSEGFSAQEIENVADSRMVAVIYDALRYRNSQTKAAAAKSAIADKPKISEQKTNRSPSKSPTVNLRQQPNRSLTIDEAVAQLRSGNVRI